MSHSIAFLVFASLLVATYSQGVTPQACGSGGAPNATNCANVQTVAACNALFPRDTTGARSALCVNPDLEDFALDCAQTCGLCCVTSAYSCGNDPTSPINCTANARYCTDSSWTTVMQTYCPGTCGFCTNASCADVLDGCRGMITLCNDVTFRTYMTTNCQRTCNLCTTTSATSTTSSTSTCSDIASNCAANSGLCNNSIYLTLMTQRCPRTCNRCTTSVTSSTTCTNANANCASWVRNGFCTNSFYTAAQRAQYCASSCGLCSVGK